MICTDMWFPQKAREYGKDGVQIILIPRSTPVGTSDKWIACGRTDAVVSGAYCLSSNWDGTSPAGGQFAGKGWIIEPEVGTVLGITSASDPFLTLDIDLKKADLAKSTYPRYVHD
jgi:N-carbamoylputrescine amidase